MRFLIIFIFLISNSFADEVINIKNLVINKELKKYEGLTFFNTKNEQLNLKEFKGNLIILNFWATWCAPCRDEMPSLNNLQSNNNKNKIRIIPINIGGENLRTSKKFFEELNIDNLKVYTGDGAVIAKNLKLRGLPTTIFIDKEGYEFARIVGSIDFNSSEFLNWLKELN